MINLFDIPSHVIDTSKFSHMLHGDIVSDFEQEFADYVGAKYACTANSASSLLFLSLLRFPKPQLVQIPSTMPIVVPNAVVGAGHKIMFYNDIDWVGGYYHLHDDIFDSAQEVTRNQFADLGKDDALMIFSFYPTKPVSGCDGGIVVSNNKDKIDHIRTMTMNGTSVNKDSWKREQVVAGYKMHWTSPQAFVANENLKKLDEKNSRLDQIKSAYNDAFGYNNTRRHLYRIRVNSNNAFLQTMQANGIMCGIHYEHCHGKRAFKEFEAQVANLKPSERESQRTVSLPYHSKLTDNEVDKVIFYVKKFT